MSLLKKIVAIATALTVLVWVGSPAMAVTVEELEAQIAALLEQLATLQSQLAALKGEVVIEGCTITSFDRNLKQGMSGDDVNCLQIVLNSDPDTQLAATGVGSPGEETSYFGPLTHAAVIKFQEKYTEDVLAPWGLTTGTGFVGTTTRAKLNELLAVPPVVECETDADCPEGYVCTAGTCVEEVVPPVEAGLTVELDADTPAAASVADNANANFTKFTLTAGSEADVSISKLYVTRSGLSANADVENIKIVDAETGVYYGSIGSLNVDNRAMITFTPDLVIEAGISESYYIRAGIVDGTTAGKTVILGIASADDIVSDASAVNGDFPINGNAMTVVSLTIGSATVSEVTTVDSKPDIGDTDVDVLAFKVDAGSTEPITIEQITVMEAGTAALDDTENIELYDTTDSKSLGEVDAWSSDGKASWSDLGIVVGKGETHRFKVRVDVVDGSGLTVDIDLIDGSDVLMTVKGNTYGFYITPSRDSWDGKGTAQTIQSGSLNISKSAATPATGSISVGDDIELAVFDFDAKGEEIKISAITITITPTDAGGSYTFDYNDITNVKLYDEDGTIVCGPKDLDSSNDAAFTDTFIVPVGVHQYTVKAKIGTDGESSDTVVADVKTPGTSITAKGMTTNDSITATPATDVAANTMTIAAGSLTVTTLDTPAGRKVAVGTTDFVWATASLDAGLSGEDIQVSTVSVLDTTGSSADADDIDNMEIWADLTDEDSTRGDAYETRVSTAENPSGNAVGADVTTSFTLTQVITVSKGTFNRIALVADLNAGASAGTGSAYKHTFTFSDVTATGATTGNSITESTSGTGQGMTVSSSGTLTITQDASAPAADIIIGGKTATLNVFRLAADEVEDLDLDNITITATGGTNVDTFYFYHGDTLLGTRPGGSTARIDVSDGTVTVPANGNVKITVKAKMLAVDGTVVTSNTDIGAIIDGTSTANSIQTTGLSSGADANSGSNSVTGSVHQLYESRPYFALNSASPSGSITAPSSKFLLAIFDVTAEDKEDITFESTSDQIKVQIAATVNDSDGTAGTWYLYDQDGNQLSSIDLADTQLIASGSITFTFEDNTFTIPAGTTKKLYVYGDLTDFEDDGDSIQIWLDDAANANCTFGIDLTEGYAEGVIIFRNDIYAGAFSNPS